MESSPDWDQAWSAIRAFTPLPDSNMFHSFFDRFFPYDKNSNKTALEIGCFPGRFIDNFGLRGYIISGIDT